MASVKYWTLLALWFSAIQDAPATAADTFTVKTFGLNAQSLPGVIVRAYAFDNRDLARSALAVSTGRPLGNELTLSNVAEALPGELTFEIDLAAQNGFGATNKQLLGFIEGKPNRTVVLQFQRNNELTPTSAVIYVVLTEAGSHAMQVAVPEGKMMCAPRCNHCVYRRHYHRRLVCRR